MVTLDGWTLFRVRKVAFGIVERMASARVLYMPASKQFWSAMAREFDNAGYSPVLWMGDWRHDDFGRREFPDCEILPIKSFHTTLSAKPVAHVPDAAILTSREFLQLKNQAIKLMDRQDETRFFGRQERDAHFYSMFNHLYSSIVEHRVELLVAGEAPHHTAQLIAYRICEMLGIPTYHLVMNTMVPLLQVNRSIVGDPIPVVDGVDVSAHLTEIAKTFATYAEGIPTPVYMSNQARYDNSLAFLRRTIRYWAVIVAIRIRELFPSLIPPTNDTGVRARYPFEKSRRRWLTPFRVESLRRHLVAEYESLAERIDLTAEGTPPFVYFPMPFEPERTSLPDGGDYYDAMEALCALRAYLPPDVHIFVKEHPSQFSRMLAGHKGRSQLSYRVIANLPNVHLVDLSVPSPSLVEHSQFVAAISGTAALEAALVGNKGVVFGRPWFSRLPGVSVFDELPAYEQFVITTGVDLNAITAAATTRLTGFVYPGTISVSQRAYMNQLFGDRIPELVNDDETARITVATITADFAATTSTRGGRS